MTWLGTLITVPIVHGISPIKFESIHTIFIHQSLILLVICWIRINAPGNVLLPKRHPKAVIDNPTPPALWVPLRLAAFAHIKDPKGVWPTMVRNGAPRLGFYNLVKTAILPKQVFYHLYSFL